MSESLRVNSKSERVPSESELVHMLYDAVIDNSLWPEMISELMEHLEQAQVENAMAFTKKHTDLVMHFERAMRLSENIVELKEKYSTSSGVLDSLAIGICVYDHSGAQVYANQFANESGLSCVPLSELESNKRLPKTHAESKLPKFVQKGHTNVALLSASEIGNTALPPNAATLAISLPTPSREALRDFQRAYYLSMTEANLVWQLREHRNLRKAATACNITYETARTYLKRIYLKTECSDQASLLLQLERNPLALLQRRKDQYNSESSTRKRLVLDDGRTLEYFDMGPSDGKLLLHFDALTGVAIDIVGSPEVYARLLRDLNMRVVVPCRPGTYRSTFKRMQGLSEFTDDVCQLMDYLGAASATLLSQAFGSCSALAFAATAQDRVEQLILCAPSYPRHEPSNWRKMDVFYIISGVIGRRAPQLLKVIVPYLMRSVMQDTRKYLSRHIANSKCAADIAILSNPLLQQRIPEMLALRTALGTEGLIQENFLNTHGWDFELNNIVAPVHIVQGELDNVSDPRGSKKLAAALPNGYYHSMQQHGQYLLFSEWPWLLEACAAADPAAVIDSAIEAS